MDVLQLVQETLDNSPLGSAGVRVYWGRRGDIDPGAKTDEYVIYTQDNDSVTEFADGGVIARTADIAVRYYLALALCRSHAGRRLHTERVNQIHTALIGAGFLCPSGWAELGDIDDVGFAAFLGVYEFARAETE